MCDIYLIMSLNMSLALNSDSYYVFNVCIVYKDSKKVT